jgi:hypothetical protein
MSAPDFIDVTIGTPITVLGASVSSIRVRNPEARDVFAAKKAAKTPEDQELNLLASLTTLSPDDLLSLKMADYVLVKEALDTFF